MKDWLIKIGSKVIFKLADASIWIINRWYDFGEYRRKKKLVKNEKLNWKSL